MNKLTLPKLSELPQYTLTLPISGIVCKFRPFLVKEEKILLLALQSASTTQIADAMRNVILECTNSELDTKKICAAEAEYAFLQIRSKSIGEESKPQVTCNTCDTATTIKVRLDKISVEKNKTKELDPNIKVTDEVTIVMKHPSLHDIDGDKDEVEMVFDLAKKCIETILVGDQVHNAADVSESELDEFVDNLLPDVFAKIIEYITESPSLKYTIRYPCPKCNKEVTYTIKDITDFFQ